MAKKKNKNGEEEQRCTFCGKNYLEVEKLIAGPPGIYICSECVKICNAIIGAEGDEENGSGPGLALEVKLIPPAKIKKKLDDYIIGQDWAKRVLAVAVYNHYKMIESEDQGTDVELEKSNILMMGPTGCGKTLLAQTLAKILDVPFTICDATPLTEAGYVGEDVENILLRLIQVADGDVARAERGIIYIDEIDKIGRRSSNPSITRDVSGEGVQQALLKIIEGTIANVPPQGGRKHPEQQYIQMDTKNILFICGGHFEGIEDAIRNRLGKKVIGFVSSEIEEMPAGRVLAQAEPEDFMKFGLIPELTGRLPIITALHPLDEDALVEIMTKPKNAIVKQYQKRFEMDKAKLEFSLDALKKVAALAMKRKTGARGIRSIVESILLDTLYELPENKKVKNFMITPEFIDAELEKDRHLKEKVKTKAAKSSKRKNSKQTNTATDIAS